MYSLQSRITNGVFSGLNSFDNLNEQYNIRQEVMSSIENIKSIVGNEQIVEELELLGVSSDEIKDLDNINNYVEKGKELLLKYLKEYKECQKQCATIETRMEETQKSLTVVKNKLFILEETHDSFKELSEEMNDKITAKEMLFLQDLQTQQALLEIQKDKLESLIKYLSKTYNIVKGTQLIHICPICLTNEIDSYIDPCGHTLCSHCSKVSYCHMCRTKVKMIKHMYYS